jgi:hypothetical protein
MSSETERLQRIKKRIKLYHREISEEEYKKIAKESMRCPMCAGRPILHMRLCMRPDLAEKIKKMKQVM